MIIPTSINQKFDNIEKHIDYVGKFAKDIIMRFCESQGFAFVSRTKTVESLTEKIESGRFSKWSELDDLFALAIIIPNLKYENEVIEFLRNSFELVGLRRRDRALKNPNVFRFDSTRFIGKIKEKSLSHPNENILNILFEVQIRSAFEHAWVVTTHDIAYKGPTIDWRILRLVSQLKASVEQLDTLVLGITQTSRLISEQVWPQILIKKRIEKFFNEKFKKKEIPLEIKPSNWSRFCDNVFNLLKASKIHYDRWKLLKLSKKVVKVLKIEIDKLGYDRFPRSISLFQFVLGVLIENNILKPPMKNNYFPFITPELVTFFPMVQEFDRKFEFEN